MRKILIVAATIVLCTTAWAQKNVYSVTACPGENASTEMRISWAQDLKASKPYVKVAEKNTKGWSKAMKVVPQQQEFCATYDSVYSKTPAGENFYESQRFTKCGAEITGLKPDTEYKYSVCGGPVHYFKTAGADEWSTCIISDFHSYTPLAHRLTDAMAMFETVRAFDPSMDWVLHLGDVAAWGGSYSFWKEMYKELPFTDFMWAGLNGNHDNMTRDYKLTKDFTRDANYYPRNGYEGQEGVCYWFRYNQALFITLNNEEMRKEDDFLKAQSWVKKVVTEQRKTKNAPRYIIVCEHYQWFYGGNGKTSQYNRWHELFDELGVDLALAGNNHIYVRTKAIFNDKVTDGSFGTVYLQTPSSDNERGQEMDDTVSYNGDRIVKRWTEGKKTVGALNMKVNNREMDLYLLDRNGAVIDTVCIPAKPVKPVKYDIRGQYMRDSLAVFEARCQKTLDAAYMAEKFISENKEIPGWEGFPVQLWEYWTGVDVKTGAKKKGLVYMLNPDARKLAKWIINAVYDATGDVRYEDVEAIRQHITWQSGAQFPVKGVVYEAMYEKDFYEPYVFKDGVTVYVKEGPMKAYDKNCTEEQLQFYLNITNDDLKDYTGRYARIASTNRLMYHLAGGNDEVGIDDRRDLSYLETVARLYKEAWNSDRNFLIYAYAYWRLNFSGQKK